jgi:hypothetical protein
VPAQAPDLYASIASFLEIRCGEDRGLAKAFEAGFSRGAVVAADAWLARAESLVPLALDRQAQGLARARPRSRRRCAARRTRARSRSASSRCGGSRPRRTRPGLEEWHDGLTLARAAIAGTRRPEGLAAAPILDEVMGPRGGGQE